MEILVIWFLFGIAAAIIGNQKGEGCAGFVAGFILGPIGLLLAIFSSGNRKPCPFCKEKIHRDAVVCPRCQRPLNAPEVAQETGALIGKDRGRQPRGEGTQRGGGMKFLALTVAILTSFAAAAQQLSNAQTIAAIGGRVVGAAKECRLDDTQVSRAGAKVLIVAKSRVKSGERGGTPDTLFSRAYEEGRYEVASGRTNCATVRESFRDLNMRLSMH